MTASLDGVANDPDGDSAGKGRPRTVTAIAIAIARGRDTKRRALTTRAKLRVLRRG